LNVGFYGQALWYFPGGKGTNLTYTPTPFGRSAFKSIWGMELGLLTGVEFVHASGVWWSLNLDLGRGGLSADDEHPAGIKSRIDAEYVLLGAGGRIGYPANGRVGPFLGFKVVGAIASWGDRTVINKPDGNVTLEWSRLNTNTFVRLDTALGVRIDPIGDDAPESRGLTFIDLSVVFSAARTDLLVRDQWIRGVGGVMDCGFRLF
jgi:hypothetical protein